MSNFYLCKDSAISDAEAQLLAEEEIKNLQEVKRFYQKCCFEFEEEDNNNIEMISVSFIYFIFILWSKSQ